MNKENKNIYYVYGCYVDRVLKYIGKGKGDRWKHCTSGNSSCKELNRDFFLGKSMNVEILYDNLSEDEALKLEKLLLSVGNSLYNKQGASGTVSFQENFVAIPKCVLRANGLISPATGKPVSVKISEKLVYSYIYDKLHGGSTSKPFLESQEDIALACGLEYRSVGRTLRSFIENGILTATRGKLNGSGPLRWQYNWINLTVLWWVGTEDNYQIMA